MTPGLKAATRPRPAAVLDAQTAQSACGGEAIGYDAGKKTLGRKRHLLVDTLGLLLVEVVKRSDDVKGVHVLPRRWVVERGLSAG